MDPTPDTTLDQVPTPDIAVASDTDLVSAFDLDSRVDFPRTESDPRTGTGIFESSLFLKLGEARRFKKAILILA